MRSGSRRDPSRDRSSGFTLIELMIAVACMGIVVSIYATVDRTQLHRAKDATYRLRALSAMEGELERLRSKPCSLAANQSKKQAFFGPELKLIPAAKGDVELKSKSDGLIYVTLKTSWSSPTGQPKQLTLVSILPHGEAGAGQ